MWQIWLINHKAILGFSIHALKRKHHWLLQLYVGLSGDKMRLAAILEVITSWQQHAAVSLMKVFSRNNRHDRTYVYNSCWHVRVLIMICHCCVPFISDMSRMLHWHIQMVCKSFISGTPLWLLVCRCCSTDIWHVKMAFQSCSTGTLFTGCVQLVAYTMTF